jgi:hypothetical protein
MPISTSSADNSTRKVAYLLLVFSGSLVTGWGVAIAVSWSHILASHIRLGYLIADIGLVTPLCVAAGLGLLRGRAWDLTVLQLAVGALAYDGVHFTVYLVQERFLRVPPAVYVAVLALVLYALVRISLWAYRRAAASQPT